MGYRKQEYTINGYDEYLRGVADIDHKQYHIDGAMDGESVTANIVKKGTDNVFCKIERVMSASKKRVAPMCKYYARCGNCSLMHIDYRHQLELKKMVVEQSLARYANKDIISDVRGLYYPFKFRNKLTLAFSHIQDKLTIGFYEEDSKKVVDIDTCILHDAWVSKVISAVRTFAGKFKHKSYSVDTLNGTLRYCVARCVDNNLMMTIVASESKVIGLSWLYNLLKKDFNTVGLYLNINTSSYSNVFSDQFVFADGEKKISGTLCGVTYELTPQSFLQSNSKMASYIYNDVVDIAKSMGVETLIDCYSGIGITSMNFAKAGLNVDSIELEQSAVYEAIRLANANKLNVYCHCGDAAELLPELLAEKPNSVVFVDPPRSGLQGAIEPLLKAKPRNIIYLSCALDSLNDDLKQLYQSGYNVITVKPYDMFPHTPHIETLVCLTRK